MDPIRVGMLFFILYFFLVVTLVVAGLALRHVRKIASLTEERITELAKSKNVYSPSTKKSTRAWKKS
jgi:NhaP-type Na+/H+ and K+/H+ antiporter